MNESKEQIILLLQGDNTLINKLPPQAHWFKPTTTQRKWSVLPLDGANIDTIGKRLKPFITVQMGNDNQIDYHLVEDFVFIRCYNAIDKTYIVIDDVLAQVKVLLHRHRFNFTGSTSIETLYQTTGTELVDEAFGLKFREARYRLLRI